MIADAHIIVNGGQLIHNAGSTFTLNSGKMLTITNGGSVSLGGTYTLPSGRTINLDNGTLAAGVFVDQGQFNWTGGTLHVEVFDGNLTNPSGGTLAPGRSAPNTSNGAAGGTTILGEYTQQSGATLEIEIGGTATATQHDFVNVTDSALLGGDLRLALINGFVPSPADQFIVFSAGSLLSFFSNAGNGQRVTTTDGRGSFLVHYGPTSIFNPNQIRLTSFELSALPGDYNGNGVVNAADYTVWRNTLGSTTNLAADGNTNNTIDVGDYNVWRQNFGDTSGTGSGGMVPEPTALVLLCATTLALLGFRLRSLSSGVIPCRRLMAGA